MIVIVRKERREIDSEERVDRIKRHGHWMCQLRRRNLHNMCLYPRTQPTRVRRTELISKFEHTLPRLFQLKMSVCPDRDELAAARAAPRGARARESGDASPSGRGAQGTRRRSLSL